MSLAEKVGYLRGLLEGSDFLGGDPKTKAVWEAVVDVLDSIIDDLYTLDEVQSELEDYVRAVDDDLSLLESEFYGEDDEDDGSIELECSECGEIVCFDEDLLYEDNVEITCFNCGAVVYSAEDIDEDDNDAEDDDDEEDDD